jgi:hypothetical protein
MSPIIVLPTFFKTIGEFPPPASLDENGVRTVARSSQRAQAWARTPLRIRPLPGNRSFARLLTIVSLARTFHVEVVTLFLLQLFLPYKCI